MFLSIDMEILTPFSSLYTVRLHLRGVKFSISTDRNVNNLYYGMLNVGSEQKIIILRVLAPSLEVEVAKEEI